MPILYSVISSRTTVIVKYAICGGNFQEVTERIIGNISQDGKMTCSHGIYFIHYICENGIIYLCVAEQEFDKNRAFLFLNEIKRRFQKNYGPSPSSSDIAYSVNSIFAKILAYDMKHYSESRTVDVISKVQRDANDLKGLMEENIKSAVARGEQFDEVIEKTQNLNRGSRSFVVHTTTLRRSMYWKNIKCYVIIGVVVIVLAYFIVSMACGGLTLKNCVAK